MSPTLEQTCLEAQAKYEQILRLNGIEDPVSEVIIKDAGLQGEGFASLTKYVTVKFENPKKAPLNLFVKIQTDNPSHIELMAEMKAYEKEARFFTEYVSAAREMCNAKGFPEFIDFYPKCYYADDKTAVLENLVLDKGYVLKDKDEGQNLECAIIAIKTLAKHHALGHAMVQESGGAENFFKRFPNLDHEGFDGPIMLPIMSSTFDACIKSNIRILEKSDIDGAKETAAKLKDFIGTPGKVMAEALRNQDKNIFRVLGHGDYWNNNMMFLMDKKGKIIHQIAIDFQITRYSSPSIDLGYYLFTSVQHDVRRAHLRELINLYIDTLNKFTNDFGYPTDLTFEEIFMDFRRHVGYGFWFGFEMAVGPGMGVYKDIDISQMDVKNWADVMVDLAKIWVNKNPDKVVETAKELVKYMKEYEELRL